MEPNKLDHLFKTGLEHEMVFRNQDSQWEVVKARLARRKRRFFLFWLPLLLVGGVMTVAANHILKNNVNEFTPELAAEIGSEQQEMLDLETGDDDLFTLENSAQNTSKAGATYHLQASPPIKKQGPDISKSDLNSSKPDNSQKSNNSIPKSSIENNQYEKLEHLSPANNSINTKAERGYTADLENRPDIDKEINSTENERNKYEMGDELNLLSIAVSPLSYNSHDPAVPALKLTPSSKKKIFVLGLSSGINSEFLSDKKIMNVPSINPYLGFSITYDRKLELALHYSQRRIDRTLAASILDYNIPILNNPYEPELPVETKLKSKNVSLDLSLAYYFWRLKYFRVGIMGGMQMNQNTERKIDYTFTGIYEVVTVKETLEPESWYFSDSFGGIKTEVPIYKGLCITAHYQYYFSNSSRGLQWKNRQRWSIGLNYKFYKK